MHMGALSPRTLLVCVVKRIVQSPSGENDCESQKALAQPLRTSAFRKLEPAAGAAAALAAKVTISADGAVECWVNWVEWPLVRQGRQFPRAGPRSCFCRGACATFSFPFTTRCARRASPGPKVHIMCLHSIRKLRARRPGADCHFVRNQTKNTKILMQEIVTLRSRAF